MCAYNVRQRVEKRDGLLTVLTPITSKFVSSSIRVRLNFAFPPFIINFVSRPANRTRPKHHAVFRRTQPRRSTLSLSSEWHSSRQVIVPSNLLSTLFGGSHSTSAANARHQSDSQYSVTIIEMALTFKLLSC